MFILCSQHFDNMLVGSFPKSSRSMKLDVSLALVSPILIWALLNWALTTRQNAIVDSQSATLPT